MKTVKDLLLAMINATLILVALCLFLLWQVSKSGERIAESFASGLTVLAPVEQSVDGLRKEVSDLRTDLAELTNGQFILTDAAVSRLEMTSARLDRAMTGLEDRMAELSAKPEKLTDYAIDKTASRAATELQTLLQCRAPEA
ncbi:hypothetical protein [Shimia haliotis]|uniref:Uncharacterized protein n=1 Tax=Shimia haliotis TaxID=1280847 RepID=A0A1I4BD74_9RHOB|nr:hypothetical protein [Shimia haliotis]SFK66067.1 hypothetical protein SAMN04488036_101934 [Shimia haliotis]